MNEKIDSILLPIIILFIAGCYFLVERDNVLSRAYNGRKGYDPKKVSYLLGVGCLGIAASCIPSLLSVIFQKMWLNIFSIIILILVLIYAVKYESDGKLK